MFFIPPAFFNRDLLVFFSLVAFLTAFALPIAGVYRIRPLCRLSAADVSVQSEEPA